MPVSGEARTVYGMLVASGERHADAIALVFEDRSLTYAELSAASTTPRGSCSRLGIGYGDSFAIYAQNCPEILIGYYAASKLGAVLVPINPNMTAAEVAHSVRHCDAKVLLHDDARRRSGRAGGIEREAAAACVAIGTL